jgi:hypothetical protein
MDSRPLPVLPPLPDERDSAGRALAALPPVAANPPAVSDVARRGGGNHTAGRPDEARPRVRHHEGRRLWSAGHAIVTCLLALALGLLLNAPGIHKRAYNQDAGWKRDLALALTGPLASVSHALLLDRPRAGIQAAIGRSGADESDDELGIEPVAASGPAVGKPTAPGAKTTAEAKAAAPISAPEPPRKQAFTPARKLKLWIAGDSLVITPGYAIRRAGGGTRVVETLDIDGRLATGLTRPDVFNWFSAIRSQLKALNPDVVVLAFGGNDDKAYMTGLPKGVSIGGFGDAAWRGEYRRRVGALFDAINRAGAHAIWLGLPRASDSSLSQRFRVINAAAAAEARERPEGATYLDTYALLAGPDGGYAEYLRRPSGELVKVRASDGVHFDRAGGDIIAREVTKALGRLYDLTSWKQKQRAADGTR